MDILEASIALSHVAEQNGISLETVIQEIDKAIEEAMADPDPMVQERWKHIPRSGEKPTALEFVAYMRSVVHSSGQENQMCCEYPSEHEAFPH